VDSPEVIRAVQFYADLYRTKLAPLPADMNAFGGGNSRSATGSRDASLAAGHKRREDKSNVEPGVIAPPR